MRASPTPASATISGKTVIVPRRVRVSIAMSGRSVMIVPRARISAHGARAVHSNRGKIAQRAVRSSPGETAARAARSSLGKIAVQARVVRDVLSSRVRIVAKVVRHSSHAETVVWVRAVSKTRNSARSGLTRRAGIVAMRVPPASIAMIAPRAGARRIADRARTSARIAVATNPGRSATVARRRQPSAARQCKTFRQASFRQTTRGPRHGRASAFLAPALRQAA